MAFLTIGGITVQTSTDSATQEQPFMIGEARRSFNGSMRVQYRGFKRSWGFETAPLVPSDWAALRNLIMTNHVQTCSGVGLENGNISCLVNIIDHEYIKDDSVASFGYRVRMKLKLEEM